MAAPGAKGETMADPIEEAKREADADAVGDKFSKLVEALGGTGDCDPDQVGYGQGGGVQAAPVGYIELRDGQTSYKRIADPARPMAMLLLFPLVGVISFGMMAMISLQVAKSLRGMVPSLPHVSLPSLYRRQ